MGKKVMKLFLDTMLRAAVIILAVAIVVMLVLLAKTVKKTAEGSGSTTQEASSIVTEEADPADPTFGGEDTSDDTAAATEEASDSSEDGKSAKDAKIVVLNASGVSGVAATWQTTLNAAGYANVDIGTYDNDSQSTTTVYTSSDYDTSDLAGLLGTVATAPRSDLDSSVSSDVDISGADIVIVIGVDNASNN